jgi:dihydroxyacetone kinase
VSRGVTRIVSATDSFANEALAGFCDLYGEFVRPVPGGVVRSTVTPRGKVAIVIGGGSGHYPAFSGYVGPGLADAAVVGNVFASPSARQVSDVARAAARGGGVVLAFGNYAGDVLNFGVAAERLRADGIDTRIIAVTDDIASAPAERANERRGVAGDVVVVKVIGAAAEGGYDLDGVMRVARIANDRTRSLGVAFAGCTLPGASEPLFTVPAGQMGVGLGIHGEPGIVEQPVVPASELAELLVDRVLGEAPAGASPRATAILNGLGSTKYEELFVLWRHVAHRLRAAGVELVRPECGELVTSLDMAGCSLTVSWLDEETMELWNAPAQSPALRRGAAIEVEPGGRVTAGSDLHEVTAGADGGDAWPEATAESAAAGARLADLLGDVAAALAAAAHELGRIDAQAGDGDHGIGMQTGSEAAFAAAVLACDGGAGVASVLAAAGDAWADQAGGTSGALWGVGLRACSGVLSDRADVTPDRVALGVRTALDRVTELGGAKLGDKTMVDALEPFVATLEAELRDRIALPRAWRSAAEAANRAADATAELEPRIGRARPLAERSLGHPDAGAVSLALCARAVADAIDPDGGSDG